MPGSTFGKNFQIHTFGESHGEALGVVIDGCPAGLELDAGDIQSYLDRRRPGQSDITTQRSEADRAEMLSGIFEGKTTGTPIAVMVRNTSQRSSDYSKLANVYRPGHADYTFDEKYGFRDYRGGGRSSGRETIGRVAAGAVAAKFLSCLGISVFAYTKSIGPVAIPDITDFDGDLIRQTALKTVTGMPDEELSKKAEEYIRSCMEEKDSVGGVIECRVTGMMPGIGEPVFDKLDAALAGAVMSIGAVKAVEIGDGITVSEALGSENNDGFAIAENEKTVAAGKVRKLSNHSGGTLGGISDGSDIILRAHVKPTPSIFRPQRTVTDAGEQTELTIAGRHDPVVVPRAVVVVEAMVALTVADLVLANTCSRMEHLLKIYRS